MRKFIDASRLVRFHSSPSAPKWALRMGVVNRMWLTAQGIHTVVWL